MNLFPTSKQTIEGVAAALRSGETTSVAVLEQCFRVIDERESSIHAWVSIDREGELARARELDASAKRGDWAGPLHGIPFGIKDLFDVAGWPTKAGSPIRESHIAEADCPAVQGLRRAGAIILGKTVTTQFASFDPPVTCNPWNLDCTPGGSSSGSAAATAAGMCLGALGSQTGGSITRPAAFCGAAGMKPTHGRLNVQGIVPLAPNLDHPGPMARSVCGLALIFDAMSDVAAGETRWPSTAKALDEKTAVPRLGVLGGFFEERAAGEMRSALDTTLEHLRRAGAASSRLPLPPTFDEIIRSHRVIMATEAAAYHERDFRNNRDAFLPKIGGLIDEGLSTPATEYIRCREHQELAKQEILGCFENADVLVCPAAVGGAPDRSTTGDPIFNSPWSYVGLPTISFPIALSPSGLPFSIQLVGKPFGEPALFQAAAWCERVVWQSA